jgi:hypothetical protein
MILTVMMWKPIHPEKMNIRPHIVMATDMDVNPTLDNNHVLGNGSHY